MMKWKDSYLVGIELIDTQHKHLFKLGNSVLEHIENHSYLNKPDEILLLVNDLIKYAKLYFNKEESYMLEIDYPLYESHKGEHEALMQKITQTNLKSITSDQFDCIQDLIIFILNWIIIHTIEIDKLVVKPII